MEDPVHDEPSDIFAEDGAVAVEGPDGVSVLLTPEAAAETGRRLLDGAAAVAADGAADGAAPPAESP